MAPNPKTPSNPPSSYSGIWKYPTNRDVPFRMAEDWLDAKRKDDDTGSLWRVFDKLYDLTPFISSHPGGSQWLEMSRGTDITEAFVASHFVNTKYIEGLLEKFFVRECSTPRISPYTLKPDGFYMTLKRRAAPILAKVGTGPTTKMLLMQDSLVLGFLIFAYLGATLTSTPMAIISGLFLGFTAIGAHNFLHLKENKRRYYFDLSLLSSYEWRITHVLSHHLYPNTLMDMELVRFPTWQFLPNRPKHWIQRKFAIFYSHLLYAVLFWMELGKRIVHVASGRKPLRPENLLPVLELLALFIITGETWTALRTWVILHTVSSYTLVSIGAVAAHHHPEIFHDGDEPLSDPDFGIGQLDATRDRAEDIFQNMFVTLITFGHHPLHHLFPTVCHSKLDHVKPIFEETAREFKINYPGIPQLELYLGCYQQLARTDIKHRRENKQD